MVVLMLLLLLWNRGRGIGQRKRLHHRRHERSSFLVRCWFSCLPDRLLFDWGHGGVPGRTLRVAGSEFFGKRR